MKTALGVWLEAGKGGDKEAQTTLGEIFEQGLGVEPDYTLAASWYEKAADQNYTRALVNLGYLYEAGLGVERDSQKALQLYRRASGLAGAVANEFTPDVAPIESSLANELMRLRSTIDEMQAEKRQLGLDLEQSRVQLAKRNQDKNALADAQQTIDELSSNIDNRDEQIARLNAEALEKQLQAAQHEAAARHKLEQTIERQLDVIKIRETELAARIAEADVLTGEIAELERASVQPTQDSVALAQRSVVGPSISLVDPQLPATRGLVKVTVATPGATQKLIGRVSAPAGLLALAVNSVPTEVNTAGVFTYDLPTNNAVTDVTVTAIDAQGKQAKLNFQILKQPSPSAPEEQDHPDLNLGEYHALLIGNSRYQNLPQLSTPGNDVERLRDILENRYGFRVTVLENATRYEILSALNDFRARLTTDDNLLIFYAGHGDLDKGNMRGHWLPVDAEPESTANWVSNVAITDIVNVMNARQVMLIVDSCYSGTLTRSSISRIDGALTDAERETWLKVLAEKRARVVLTSGGLAPVLDAGGGKHSVFAKALITVLANNTELLAGRSLYQAVAARVAYAASTYEFEQIPQYAPIARAGHEAGDFFLLPARP